MRIWGRGYLRHNMPQIRLPACPIGIRAGMGMQEVFVLSSEDDVGV